MAKGSGRLASLGLGIIVLLILNMLTVITIVMPDTQVKASSTLASEVNILITNIEKVISLINYRITLLEQEGYTVPEEIKSKVNELNSLLAEVKEKYDKGEYDEAKKLALKTLEISYTIIETLPLPRELQRYINKVMVKSDIESTLNILSIINRTILRASVYVENKTVIMNLTRTLNKVKKILIKAMDIADKEPGKAKEMMFTVLMGVMKTQWMFRSISEEIGVKKAIKIIREKQASLVKVLDRIAMLQKRIEKFKDIARADIAILKLEEIGKLINETLKGTRRVEKAKTFKHAFRILEGSLEVLETVKALGSSESETIELTIEIMESENVTGIARAILAQAQALEKALTGLKTAVEKIPTIPPEVKENITRIIDISKNLTLKIKDLVGYIIAGDYNKSLSILEDIKLEVEDIKNTIAYLKEELKGTPGPHIGLLRSIENIVVKITEHVELLTKKVLEISSKVKVRRKVEETKLREEAKHLCLNATKRLDKIINRLEVLKEKLIEVAEKANVTERANETIRVIDEAINTISQLKEQIKDTMENVTDPASVIKEVNTIVSEAQTIENNVDENVYEFIIVLRDIILDKIESTISLSESITKQPLNITKSELKKIQAKTKELKAVIHMLGNLPKDSIRALEILDKAIDKVNTLATEIEKTIKEILGATAKRIIERAKDLLDELSSLKKELRIVIERVREISSIINETIDTSTLNELLVEIKNLEEKIVNITVIVNVNVTKASELLVEVEKEVTILIEKYGNSTSVIVSHVLKHVREHFNNIKGELEKIKGKAKEAKIHEVEKILDKAIKEIEKLEEKLEKLKGKASEKIKTVMDIVQELKELMKEVKESTTKSLKEKLNELKKEIEKERKRIEKLIDLAKSVSEKANATKDVKENIEELTKIVKVLKELLVKISKVEEEPEALIEMILNVTIEVEKMKDREIEITHNIVIKIKDKVLISIESTLERVDNVIEKTTEVLISINVTTPEDYVKELKDIKEHLENLKNKIRKLPVNATEALTTIEDITDKLVNQIGHFKESCKELKGKVVGKVEETLTSIIDKMEKYRSKLKEIYDYANITDYTEVNELEKVIKGLKELKDELSDIAKYNIEKALEELKKLIGEAKDEEVEGKKEAKKGIDKAIDKVKEELKQAEDEISKGKEYIQELKKIVNVERLEKTLSETLKRISEFEEKLTKISGMKIDEALKVLCETMKEYKEDLKPKIRKAKHLTVKAKKCCDKGLIKLFEQLNGRFKALNNTIDKLCNTIKTARNIPEDVKKQLLEKMKKIKALIAKSISEVKESILSILEGDIDKAKSQLNTAKAYMEEAKGIVEEVAEELNEYMKGKGEVLKGSFNECMEMLSKVIDVVEELMS